MTETPKRNPRLTEEQVLDRLDRCESPDVIKQFYDFGLLFSKDVLDRIKALEAKAISFAAYGAAVVSIIVATATYWNTSGNQSTKWIALFAAGCGLACNVYAVRALLLAQTEAISQDDWLNEDSLNDPDLLQRFRIVSLWGVIRARNIAEDQKAANLRRAQIWLSGAVTYLAFLLIQVVLYTSLKGNVAWIMLSPRPIWVACWYLFVRTGWGFGCICGLGLWIAYRLSRRLL